MIGVCSVTFKDKTIEEVIQLAKKPGWTVLSGEARNI